MKHQSIFETALLLKLTVVVVAGAKAEADATRERETSPNFIFANWVKRGFMRDRS